VTSQVTGVIFVFAGLLLHVAVRVQPGTS
jgi:hypothetical protein